MDIDYVPKCKLVDNNSPCFLMTSSESIIERLREVLVNNVNATTPVEMEREAQSSVDDRKDK